jgi:hypothetical protein
MRSGAGHARLSEQDACESDALSAARLVTAFWVSSFGRVQPPWGMEPGSVRYGVLYMRLYMSTFEYKPEVWAELGHSPQNRTETVSRILDDAGWQAERSLVCLRQ